MLDPFDEQADTGARRLPLGTGAVLLRGFGLGVENEVLAALRQVIDAPWQMLLTNAPSRSAPRAAAPTRSNPGRRRTALSGERHSAAAMRRGAGMTLQAAARQAPPFAQVSRR